MNGDLACRLGVDVGGTFTDLVLLTSDGCLVTRKVLSTSSNYAEAIFTGIADLLQEAGIVGGKVQELIHGTTIATNAIIERRGARTGLVTTEGFRDLLEIGRLRLMRLYDMDQERPPPLVRRRWRFEVAERLDHRGEVIHPLDRASLERAIAGIVAENLEAVAVCLIHAYANPAHERAVAASIPERLPKLYLTLSEAKNALDPRRASTQVPSRGESCKPSVPQRRRRSQHDAADGGHADPLGLDQVPQAGLIAVRCLPQAASVFSPRLVVEEHDMLFDRVAPDVQFVGQEVWVGIADGQAAYDRELRRDAQLGSDDVGISRHRNFHAGAQPPCGQGQHQGLQIHTHTHCVGRAKVPMHRDDAGQRCAKEIEVAHHSGCVSRRVCDGDTHRAVNLRPKLIAVMLERFW